MPISHELYVNGEHDELKFLVEFEGRDADEFSILKVHFYIEDADDWTQIELNHFLQDHPDEREKIEAKIIQFFEGVKNGK